MTEIPEVPREFDSGENLSSILTSSMIKMSFWKEFESLEKTALELDKI